MNNNNNNVKNDIEIIYKVEFIEKLGNFYIHSINGFIGNRSSICSHFGLNYNSVYSQMYKHNLTFEEAINKSLNNKINGIDSLKRYEINGIKGTRKEICNYFNISLGTITTRMNVHKESFEDAVKYFLKNGVKKVEKIHTIYGFTGNQKEICDHFYLECGSVYQKMRRNHLTFEESIKYFIKHYKINV